MPYQAIVMCKSFYSVSVNFWYHDV